MTNQDLPEVSICICTYRRPALLLQLLESIAIQTYPSDRFEVVVIDNDIAASAAQTIEEVLKRYPMLSLRYELEARQGISYARNKSVSIAKGSLLAFIDDDEWAVNQWLSDLVQTLVKLDVDAVLGPIIASYPKNTQKWIVRSRFFERPRFPSGTLLQSEFCRSGNFLIRASSMKTRGLKPFDESLSHLGGEDFEFFRWLDRQGGKAVWCDTAVVHEEVLLTRQTLSFVLKRSLRVSTNYWRTINSARSAHLVVSEAVLGACIGLVFAAFGLFSLPLGFHCSVRSWVISAKGFGRVAAMFNIRFLGYRLPPFVNDN